MNFIHRLVNSFSGLTVPCLLFKFVLLTLIENGAFFVEINQISEKCHTSWNNMILVPPRRPSFWCFIVYYILKEPRAFFIYLLIYSLFFFAFCVTILHVFFGVLLVKNVTHGEMEAMSVTDLMLCSQQSRKLFYYACDKNMILNRES